VGWLRGVGWLLAGCVAIAVIAGGIYVEARTLGVESRQAPRSLDARPRPVLNLPPRRSEEAVMFAARG